MLLQRIYQIYTRYIPRTWFSNIIMFLPLQIRVCLWWLFPIYRMVLSRNGYSLLRRYTVYNKAMEYIRNIPWICMVYTWIFLFLVWLLYYGKKKDETATATQNSHVQITSKAGSLSSLITKHVLLNSFISQVYTRYILVISLQQHACSQTCRDVLALDFRQILPVFVTYSPPTGGT